MYICFYNLQRDVTGLLDGANALVVEYAYEAWDKLLFVSNLLPEGLGGRNQYMPDNEHFVDRIKKHAGSSVLMEQSNT